MSRPRPAGGREAREADRALVAVLSAAIVLLLFVANVQLWRQGSRDEAAGRGAATAGSALPPPVSGTSNNVLSKQMRRLSAQLRGPLNGLSAQVAGLQGVGDAQRGVAAQIKAMSDSIRRFGSVRGELGQVTDGMGRMVANTRQMSNGLVTMGRDMSATRTSMGSMVRVMKRVEGGIAATNASSREASSGIASMRDATSAMAQSIAATTASSREMTASMAALSQRMGALVEIFCVAFSSTLPACEGGEASGSTALAPDRPTVEEVFGGEQPEQGLSQQGLSPALPLGP